MRSPCFVACAISSGRPGDADIQSVKLPDAAPETLFRLAGRIGFSIDLCKSAARKKRLDRPTILLLLLFRWNRRCRRLVLRLPFGPELPGDVRKTLRSCTHTA